MRVALRGVILLGALVLPSCRADSVSTSPRRVVAGPDFSAADAEQRVTGSATIILPDFGNALERYSVSAIHHSDGTTTGEFEESSEQDGGQRIHAHVVCFSVVGTSARLSAQIDQSNVPFGSPGAYVVWSVIDGGEGAKSPPDQTTDIFFGATRAQAEFHCEVGFNLAPYFSSIRGNLQVE